MTATPTATSALFVIVRRTLADSKPQLSAHLAGRMIELIYDAEANMSVQTMPGGITQRAVYDGVGEMSALSYTGPVTTATGTDPNGTWLAWSARHDAAGRIRQEWTPAGAAFTGDLNSGGGGGSDGAVAYERQYRYDRAGRLVTVHDRTNDATGTTLNPDTPASTSAACQTRKYTFDVNGNRTALTRWGAAADGACATAGDGTATTWNYSNADRLTSGAGGTGNYDYDNLARATTIPAIDTPRGASNGPGAGNLAIGYYDSDAVRTLTQDGLTTTYTLDAAGRRLTAATDGPNPSTLTRHYSDDSDNPSWVSEETSGGQAAVTRYAGSLGGGLATEIAGDGALTLRLANPHGDAVATVQIPATGPATGITAWADYDEYGNPRTTVASSIGGAAGYGWLGAKERATDDSGLLLMGARLYNPVTGQFTSLDPVYGGGATAYAYPTDPVNMSDLDGRFWGAIAKVAVRGCIKFCGKVLKPVAQKTWSATKWVVKRPWAGWNAIRRGHEWGTRNWRIAPFGNRGFGRVNRPHYHRRVTGQNGQRYPDKVSVGIDRGRRSQRTGAGVIAGRTALILCRISSR